MIYDIGRLGITELNVMQEEMQEVCRKSRQVVLLSPTGSGKTLSYLLPLLQQMRAEQDLQALVLVPSRELAIQTHEVAHRLCPSLRSMACYGGRAAMDEHRTMKGLRPQLLIATPGRMLDHIQKGNVEPDSIRFLVIDEFDKSLELGFQQQMADILRYLTHVERRILLSATDNPQIPDFVGCHNFQKLSYLPDDEQIPSRISLYSVSSPEKDKLETLFRLLCSLGTQKSLVFVNYRQSVERVGDFLRERHIPADVFHGGMEQRDRERALFRFSNGSCNVFVSTDLAARGLDIANVDNIIHYHLPLNEEAFIHRNGRTARWEDVGSAFLILGPEERLPEYIATEVQKYEMPAKPLAPSLPLWVTIYIGKGKKDKISRGDILGFLTKVGGMDSRQIGRIDVLPGWSYVAVARSAANQLLSTIRGQKIKGQKTIFAVAE